MAQWSSIDWNTEKSQRYSSASLSSSSTISGRDDSGLLRFSDFQ